MALRPERVPARPNRRLLSSLLLVVGLLPLTAAAQTDYTWIGGDGNWSDAANWSPKGVPGAADNAFITAKGAYTVTLDVDGAVTDLTLGDGNDEQVLFLSGRTLTLGGTGQIMPGARMQLERGSSVEGGTVLLNQGTLRAANDASSVSTAFSNAAGGLVQVAAGKIDAELAFASGFNNRGRIHLTNLDGGAASAATLSIKDGALVNVSGGTIESRSGALDGPRVLAVVLDNRGTVQAFDADLTITRSGAIHTNSGLLLADGGNVAFSDHQALTSSGTVLVEAGRTVTVGGSQFINEGRVEGLGKLIVTAPALENQGTVVPGVEDEVPAKQALAAAGELTLTGDFVNDDAGTLAIDVNGTSPGSGYDLFVVNGAATLGGTLAVSSGFTPEVGDVFTVLTFDSSTGTFDIYTGLDVGDGVRLEPEYTATSLQLRAVAEATTYTWVGDGFSQGEWHVAANWNPTAVPGRGDTAIIDNGTVTLAADAEVAELSLQAAELLGDGHLTITSSLTLGSNGQMTGSGTTVLAAGAEATFDADAQAITLSRRFENNGIVQWTAGQVNGQNQGPFVNKRGATWRIEADAIFYPEVISEAGSTILKQSSGTTQLVESLDLNGAFTVEAGTLLLGNPGGTTRTRTVGGTVTLAGGATLRFDPFGSTPLVFESGSRLEGAGAVQFRKGTTVFQAGSAYAMTGPVLLQGGGAQFDTGSEVVLHDLVITDFRSVLTGSDVKRTAGNALLGPRAEIAGEGTLVVSGRDTLRIEAEVSSGTLGPAMSGRVENEGVVHWTAGQVNGQNQGPFVNKRGATWLIEADAIFYPEVISEAGSTILKQSSGTTQLVESLDLNGAFTVEAGTVVLGNPGGTDRSRVLGGTLTLADETRVQLYPLRQTLELAKGSRIEGTGTVEFAREAVTNGATWQPGVSPGIITIEGSYVPTADGVLNLELAGTMPGAGYDRLAVTGTATLNGTLRVTLLDGFLPADTDTFHVLTFAERTGDFAAYEGLDLGDGRTLAPVFTDTSLALAIAGEDNTAPVTQDVRFATTETAPLTGTLQATDADGDALTFALLQTGTLGTAVLDDAALGTFTYTPGAIGVDTVTFQASDGLAASDTGTVVVTVVSADGLQADAETVVLYKFDEPVPGISYDASGNGLDGIDDGTTPAEGRFGQARQFDGEDDRIDMDVVRVALLGSSAWTFEYIARSVEGSRRVPELVNHRCGNGWWLGPRSNTIRFGIKTDAAGACFWTVGEAFAEAEMDTDWHYYVLTWDGATLSMYRDGDLLDSRPAPGNFRQTQTFSQQAWIGYSDSGAGAYSSGLADELRVSDIARSAEDIVATAEALGFSAKQVPVAADDAATTDEDEAVRINVLRNDTDPEADALTLTGFDAPDSGTVVQDGDSVLIYTPEPDFNGSDAFNYVVSDGAATDTARVTVTVQSVNDAPVFTSTPPTSAKEGVVYRYDVTAADVDGDALVLVAATAPDWLAFTDNGDGTGLLTGTPAAGDVGEHPVVLTVNDRDVIPTVKRPGTEPARPAPSPLAGEGRGEGESLTESRLLRAEQAFTITVVASGENAPPDAADDAATTDEDTPVTLDVLANDTDLDGDTLRIVSVTEPANGAVTTQGDSLLVYTPAAEFNGSDAFTYVAADGNGGQDTAAVAITVRPVNDAPVAVSDTTETPSGLAVTIPVLANDVDIDSDTLQITAIESPTPGGATVVIGNDSTLRYTPAAGFEGNDTFTYTISDGEATASASVVVTVLRLRYAVTDLGTLGGAVSLATALNDDGTVAGLALDASGEIRAFRWAEGTMTLLSVPGAVATRAYAIGLDGTVAGTAVLPDSTTRAVIFAPDGTPELLGGLGGTLGIAYGLVDDGTIVGTSETPSAAYHATRWQDGAATDLGAFGGAHSEAFGVNEQGLVVGAVTMEEGTVQPLLGTQAGEEPGRAYAVNDGGMAVGSRVQNEMTEAARWNIDTRTMTGLEGIGGAFSEAYGVNEAGWIVGTAEVAGASKGSLRTQAAGATTLHAREALRLQAAAGKAVENLRAVLWIDDRVRDLNTLIDPAAGWTLVEARAINRQGQIAGYGLHDGEDRAFLLAPVDNTPPLLRDDVAEAAYGQAVLITVFTNDTDADGDTLAVIHLGPAQAGTVRLEAPGLVRYTPPPGFSGNDRFTYRAADTRGSTAEAVVTVHIAAEELPDQPVLAQNYPNPFNPQTLIRFALPEDGRVTLAVFDVTGRQVALLVEEQRAAGAHEVPFDASALPSGVYFYRLQTPQGTMIRSMVLLR